MNDLAGKVILVTGASGNLGQAAARAFARAGSRLVLIDRVSERLSSQFPEWSRSQEHFLIAPVDMTQPGQVKDAVEEVSQRAGRIDVLINTVGGYRGGTPLHETPVESWDFMLELNLRTAIIVSQAVVPVMLAQGEGKIIHVGSRNAVTGSANSAAYSAAKSGVVRLTESLAAELKSKGINVNCVLPGTIDTPQNRADMPNARFERWVAPEAIADVFVFLASDMSRAIHGAAIPVYGLS